MRLIYSGKIKLSQFLFYSISFQLKILENAQRRYISIGMLHIQHSEPVFKKSVSLHLRAHFPPLNQDFLLFCLIVKFNQFIRYLAVEM